MRRPCLSVFTALVMAGSLLLCLAAQAAAASGAPSRAATASVCPAQKVCMFSDAGGGGQQIEFTFTPGNSGEVDLTTQPCSGCTNGIHGNDGTWNDQMSSWSNNSGVTVAWYVNTGAKGTCHLMTSRGPAFVQNVTASENDTASSISTKTSGCH